MTTTSEESWRSLLVDPDAAGQLGALWGKSPEKAGGRTNLLLQHLFDAMAVAGILWDAFIAPVTRRSLDEATAGNGRRLFAWLAGLHDLGKAIPCFQGQVPALADLVRQSGLEIPRQTATRARIRHELASASILRDALLSRWPDRDQVEWVWPLLAGHHGILPSVTAVTSRPLERQERLGSPDSWGRVQSLIVSVVTRAVGCEDVGEMCPRTMPTRGEQLALSGLVTMADWIASDEVRFGGIDRLDRVGIARARERARSGWDDMRLKGGWTAGLPLPGPAAFTHRFPGRTPRPLQLSVTESAMSLPAPGLVLIEAPMGEGKTEAALLAAEILCARFGANGICVAMPTQATSDAMYARVQSWLRTFDSTAPLALLHGSHIRSERVRARASRERCNDAAEPDEYGLDEDPPSYRSVAEDGPEEAHVERPAEWFYGRYRGLLTANAVGTVDQVLFAATRTKYVALRFAGLAGKVVIFDEVHAADCYMSVFLREALFWLGSCSVPVVLLSATLPPAQRDQLVGSYVGGAALASGVPPERPPTVAGYPRTLTACVAGRAHYSTTQAPAWRPSRPFTVSVSPEEPEPDQRDVVVELRDRLSDGGVALVMRNTVRRAQDTFSALRSELGVEDVVLLHGLFTANARARKTDALLRALGEDGTNRPSRLVVVATQVAEQSFDIDADVLVTDLAPIDLLLQRAGRVHRHDRPASARPAPVRVPHMVVTGILLSNGVPGFPGGSLVVYGRHLLLRAAALTIEAAAGQGWSIPEEVPRLVDRGYGSEPLGPAGWAEAEAEAAAEWRDDVDARRRLAEQYRLLGDGDGSRPTLDGLHVGGSDPSFVRVRDGNMGEEVILLVRSDRGYATVDGLHLGPNGDAARDRPECVLGASVRLPDYLATEPAIAGLGELPGWRDDPWLGKSRALVLAAGGPTRLGSWDFSYRDDIGLVIEKCP